MTLQLISAFGLLHTLGAVIGTAFTTFAEAFYTRAAADDRISHHERKYLRRMFRGLKFGMLLVLCSGIGLIVCEYLVPSAPETVLTAPFWAFQTLTYVVIILGWLLSKDKAPWWFSSAAILVGWWMILLIDLGLLNPFGYIELMLSYIFTTFIVAGLLHYFRVWARRNVHSHGKT
jgi:hypothetical protein